MQTTTTATFPTLDYWQRKIVAPGDDQFKEKRFYDYYRNKAEIAYAAQPKRICEIGVRYGYSAFAILAGAPGAEFFIGVDILPGKYGGVRENTFPRVCEILGREFPAVAIWLSHFDTRTMLTLGISKKTTIAGTFDFIHVDGDHTEAGCLHDLLLAIFSLTPGGTILVDDYTYVAGVTRAVDKFVAEFADHIESHYCKKSLRGEYIIKITGGSND